MHRFPAVLLREVDGEPADARLRGTREVTLRRLDLDHVGAEIRQRLPARRSRQHAGEIEDGDPVERPRSGAHRSGMESNTPNSRAVLTLTRACTRPCSPWNAPRVATGNTASCHTPGAT